jgi:hypothetical protein
MQTVHLFLIAGAFSAFCSACRQDGHREPIPVVHELMVADEQEVARVREPLVFAIDEMTLSGDLPNELNYVTKCSATPLHTTGAVVVEVGKEFSFTVQRQSTDIATLRKDVAEGTDLFEVVFFDEGDDSFFYEAVLPDGRSAGHHYVRLLELEGRTFVVRTNEQRHFGYFSTQLAARTINTLSVVR